MIVLPDRNIPRARFLMPVFDKEWRTPSQAKPKDQFGNDVFRTRFRINAKSNDGVVIWSGWFDDRADFDAFLWAIACGTLKQERALWDLPTPNWQPWMGELLSYEFATVSIITSTSASNQTYDVPYDYNTTGSSVETIGGGGSGGATNSSSGAASRTASGGGGGAWNKATDVSLAAGGTATFFIGVAKTGTAFTTGDTSRAGTAGSDTWFNGTTLAGSSVGSKAGGGGGAAAGSSTGGAGGVGSSGIGTSSNNGGRGGNNPTNPANQTASGGGGAGGESGAGVQGVDNSTDSTGSNGGAGNNNTAGGGTAGTGANDPSTAAGDGGTGTNIYSASTIGSGGGGGGLRSKAAGSIRAGNAGDYGAGGGGMASGQGTCNCTNGSGGQGIIVITYTPIFKPSFNMPMLGM